MSRPGPYAALRTTFSASAYVRLVKVTLLSAWTVMA
jgi:hypothetical protein